MNSGDIDVTVPDETAKDHAYGLPSTDELMDLQGLLSGGARSTAKRASHRGEEDLRSIENNGIRTANHEN
jgi:hypothetical protein